MPLSRVVCGRGRNPTLKDFDPAFRVDQCVGSWAPHSTDSLMQVDTCLA